MKDRNVQYPHRYIDQTGNYWTLTPSQGTVTEVGSIYNRASVLPTSVCQNLGLNPDTAEPKDAFAAVASGRYYGKISSLTGGNAVGNSAANNDYVDEICKFTSAEFNDYGSLEKESGQSYYTKIPIPNGAKRIRITAVCAVARGALGRSSVNLEKNGANVDTLLNLSASGEIASQAVTREITVTGSGTEYYQIRLYGSNHRDSSDRGRAGCSSFKMEVTA